MDELTGQCLQADEIAYNAYLEFKDPEQNSNWKLFEQALEHGIDSIDEPGPALEKLSKILSAQPKF